MNVLLLSFLLASSLAFVPDLLSSPFIFIRQLFISRTFVQIHSFKNVPGSS